MQSQEEPKFSAHERKAGLRYGGEMLACLVLYIGLLVPSIRYGRGMDAGWLKLAVLVSPMIGFLLMIWVIARQVARMDEYLRRVLLENIAIGTALTASATFTYGFLETAGYPLLSMFTVWMILGGSIGVITIGRKWIER
jgi:hypothetical protein